MSHYPPYGPYGQHPPPYSQPPPPHAYTYVPTPAMVPVYPGQPGYPGYQPEYQPPGYQQPGYQPPVNLSGSTEPVHPPLFVTNNVYQPVAPVPVEVPDPFEWIPTTATTASLLSHRAFVGGKEGWDGSPLWVIRSHHSGELVPGKLAIKHRSAYIPHAGKEVPVHNIEVLCAPAHALRWIAASNGEVPPGAIVAGNTHNAEPLYVARVPHRKSITPGKVHSSHGCCYISFERVEISFKNYEVLCKCVG